MKQLTKTIFFLLIVLFISSCNSEKEKRNPEFLAPLKIEIPKELESNEDAIDFIKSSEIAINEFSDNIEKLAFDGKIILSKNIDEMDSFDKIKLGKMAIQFVSNSSQMTNTLENTQKYVEDAKANGIDESQIKSFEIIENTIENRISEINNKYKNYFN